MAEETKSEHPKEECPLCGDEYTHFRIDESMSRNDLRSDATQCRVKVHETTFEEKWYVYVHL